MDHQLLILKSSAGSGKTFSLVTEYLKILLPNPAEYRSVLAITFTNKATEEMKDRIICYLADLVALRDLDRAGRMRNPVYALLDTHFASMEEVWRDRDICTQASYVLERILNDYSNFSVSTIESFFQRILRSLTRELKLNQNYDLEMNQDAVLQRLVDALMLDLGEDASLLTLMEGFIDHLMEDRGNWKLEQKILGLGKEIFKEEFQTYLRKFPDAAISKESGFKGFALDLANKLREITRAYRDHHRDIAEHTAQLLEGYGVDEGDFYGGKYGAAYFLTKGDKLEPNRAAWTVMDDPGKWRSGKGKNNPNATEELIDQLDQLLHDLIEFCDDNYLAFCTATEILKSIHAFGLMGDLQQKAIILREEENILLISDTGAILDRAIGQQEDAPFLYEKTGTRYKHYLLDEFQDTSDLQWSNLRPLVLEGLANGWGSLVVGDVKQSIYRWRNGNMELLMSQVEEDIRKAGKSPESKSLDSNYRTAPEIVDFNNDFFRFALRQFEGMFDEADYADIASAYADVEQTAEIKKIEGYVELQLLKGKEKDDPEGTPSFKDRAMDAALRTILDAQEDGFGARDICILVRAKIDGTLIAGYLQEKGIDVVSADSLLLTADRYVQLIEALLRFLVEPGDLVNAALLRHLCNDDDDTKDGHHHLFAAKMTEGIPSAFLSAIGKLKHLPVYEAVEQILKMFPEMEEPNPYILGFLDAVLEYSSTQQASLSGFLEWWEDEKGKRALASAAGIDAVQIVTIHSAKGLEFPIVIVPFLIWELGPKSTGTLWVEPPRGELYEGAPFLPIKSVQALESTDFAANFKREILLSHIDNLNLMYVAFTRPQYRIYIFAPQDTRKSGALNRSSHLLNLYFQLQRESDEEMKEEEVWTRGERMSKEEILRRLGDSAEEGPEQLSLSKTERTGGVWSERIRIAGKGRRYLPTSTDGREHKIKAGEWMHEVLAHITTTEDVGLALRDLSARGESRSDSLDDMKNHLLDLLSREDLRDWYSGGWTVKNEADILTADGRILRPDRVMIRGDRAVVLDYKTGVERSFHPKQVRDYMAVLSEMGYTSVEGYLLYLGSGMLQQVSA